jgi:hypothetical protein
MATSYAKNLTTALRERTADLAAAPDPQTVDTIVAEAETEAQRRTEIPDTFVYRMTVIVLGVAVVTVIAAQLWITLQKGAADIPDGLIALGSAAIGALAGLLAPTPAN